MCVCVGGGGYEGPNKLKLFVHLLGGKGGYQIMNHDYILDTVTDHCYSFMA